MFALSILLNAVLASSSAFAYTDRPFIIAVAGGSASGKTHNAKLLVEALGADRAELVSADNYYAPERQSPEFYLNGRINYDHPTAVDLETLAAHLSYLRSGFPVRIKEYTYGQKVEKEKIIDHHPKEFIVVEGIFVLYPKIADLVDYRVFVNVDRETRLERRLIRDQKERGLTPEEITSYFESVVEPMHAKFIQGSALTADTIIRSPNDPERVAEIVKNVELQAREMRQVKSSIMMETYLRAMKAVRAKHPDDFSIARLDELNPSQPDLGFLALTYKSDLVDRIVRETALRPERASALEEYLEKNPVPFIEVDGKKVVTDHHHLMMALHKKGISEFLMRRTDESTVDPGRLRWLRGQNRFMTFQELRNNPYRSLASLVRDLGYVRKTGKPHEEFEWADYYRERLARDHQLEVTEHQLLNVDERQRIVDLAISLARDPAASRLPGYVVEDCQNTLEKSAD